MLVMDKHKLTESQVDWKIKSFITSVPGDDFQMIFVTKRIVFFFVAQITFSRFTFAKNGGKTTDK